MAFNLFRKREPRVIADIAEKRKAVERFCASQQGNCNQCHLHYKIPWADECHHSDEEVEARYRALYGDADPKKLNERCEKMADREELIKLLESAESAVYWNSSDRSFIEKIADHLIAHGVRTNTVVSFHMITIDPVSEKITAAVDIDGVGFEVPLTLHQSGRRMLELLIADAQGRVEILPTKENTAAKDINVPSKEENR